MRPDRVAAAVLLLLAAVVPVRPVPAADIEVLTTPAGIEVWLAREPSIPIVAMKFAFEGGASLDPEGRAGLANMVSGLLDQGAGDLDDRAFRDRLDDLSARLRFDAGRDAFRGSLMTLTGNLDAAADLLRLALNAPRFDDGPVERVRARILAALARDGENPHVRAWRAWRRAAFPDHAYGRPVDGAPESVAAIGAADLERFVRDGFARDRLHVAVVGDIAPERTTALVDAVFAGLPADGAPFAVPDVAAAKGGVFTIDMDMPQSAIVFGLPGPRRDDPDYYAASVLNRALGGGGLNTRLFEEVREKRGLAYSVSSFLHPHRHAGLWVGSAGTRNERAGDTLDVIRAVVADVAENGLADREIDDAKAWLTGSFPLRLDGAEAIAGMLVAVRLHGLGVDYLDERAGFIEAVDAEDVRRVARRMLDADDLLVVVAGRPEGIEETSP